MEWIIFFILKIVEIAAVVMIPYVTGSIFLNGNWNMGRNEGATMHLITWMLGGCIVAGLSCIALALYTYGIEILCGIYGWFEVWINLNKEWAGIK
jgi:hypothetical protein